VYELISKNMGVCVCIFLYVFECLKQKKKTKKLNVLIAYDQVSQKYKENHIA